MSIRIVEKNPDHHSILKAALRAGGTYVNVLSNGHPCMIQVSMRKVPSRYHRIEIDIECTGYKISNEVRRGLKIMIEQADCPDARIPKLGDEFTTLLAIEVQREDERMRGEQINLETLFDLLEEDENLEEMKT